MASGLVIIYQAGPYCVRQLYRLACVPCTEGWQAGTLRSPKQGGALCEHGPGEWQVGTRGKRDGWYPIGPRYASENAAKYLADALQRAAGMRD